ncbi:hypothetical protein AB833_17265 [Chromatiales bacterium (ex Bugula neritina AB1)]|nr:hypothetical protein AB833_17265 [Chromatiales bacterium (ex Bugula neritina AB1)]
MIESNAEKSGTGLLNVMKSAAAAAFGVQSQANREKDFENGKPLHFIIAGILMTLLFLAGVGLFVQYMIATTP